RISFSPPHPPLHLYSFPNTTLFRSSTWTLVVVNKCLGMTRGRRFGALRLLSGQALKSCSSQGARAETLAAASMEFSRARAPAPQDRKSTRLNSSHVAISYAVFCLKK